tara:strand:+ start:991 stop:3876 length:2886 start_codon:yes stop_codon:yes gene_type:complete
MTQKTHWIQEVKSRYSLESIAYQLGMKTTGRNAFGPCPSCNAQKRGDHDKRAPLAFFVPLGSKEARWQCFSCGDKGDMIDLVSYKFNGVKGSQVGDWTEIKNFFKTHEFTDIRVIDKPKSKIPKKDLKRLWSEGVVGNPIDGTARIDVQQFFKDRGLNHYYIDEGYIFDINFPFQELEKVITSSGKPMPFWPAGWAYSYPIAIPLFDANGTFCSFQGRAIRKQEGKPKTMCPAGFSMDGLFFANTTMRQFLLKEYNSNRFWIVEGEMDFLAITSKQANEPVMGIKNGSFSAFDHIAFPAGAEVIIATHNDTAGNEYAKKIAVRIAPHKPKRILLQDGDINDFIKDGNTFQDLVGKIQDYPDYDSVSGEMAIRIMKDQFFRMENAKRAERQNLMDDLIDQTEAITAAFKTNREEATKIFTRIKNLHGCGAIASKMLQGINSRLQSYESAAADTLLNTPTEIATVQGPDPSVELLRKPIRAKGQIVGYGAPLALEANIQRILTNDRRWAGRLRYNKMKGEVEVDEESLKAIHVTEFMIWLQENYEGLRLDPSAVGRVMNQMAERNYAYHPVQEILTDWWKNVDLSEAPDHARPEHLFTYYFRAESKVDEKKIAKGGINQKLLNEAYGRIFCRGFVARQFFPDCIRRGKFDYTPIVISPAQGIGKGKALESLAIEPEFFHRGNPNIDKKDTEIMLSGCSVFEFEECVTFIENPFTKVKMFLTKSSFKLRKPYGKGMEDIPASVVYVGSTNEESLDFLGDPTGSRRFMSMIVGVGGDLRVEELRRDLKYIYARAMHSFYGTGEYANTQYHPEDNPEGVGLPKGFNLDCRKTGNNKAYLEMLPNGKQYLEWQTRSNARFAAMDPWIPYVSDYCEEVWKDYHRAKRAMLADAEKLLFISVKTLLDNVLKIPAMKQDRKASKRVGEVLIQVGLKPSGQKWHGKKKVAVWKIPMGLFKEPTLDELSKGR